MKYLFITLSVQDGERNHTHRVLHTTNAKDINFAAERYAATYWGYGSHDEDGRWWFNGEMAIKVDNVVELSSNDYYLVNSIFMGTYVKKW